MEIKQRIELAKKILGHSSYQIQKEELIKFFDKTNDKDPKDILLRLILIDSCYSTNMNRRLFGFEELTDFILKELEPQITSKLNVVEFIEKNKEILKTSIGIDKKGNSKGHAFSLITKYLYFRTKLEFPIYDNLVFEELVNQDNLKLSQKSEIGEYFKILNEWKLKYEPTWDNLDKYFWICGKIRKGSFSLLFNDKKSYKNMLNEFNIISDKKLKSTEVDDLIVKRLKSPNLIFNEPKLKDIQKLFIEITSKDEKGEEE